MPVFKGHDSTVSDWLLHIQQNTHNWELMKDLCTDDRWHEEKMQSPPIQVPSWIRTHYLHWDNYCLVFNDPSLQPWHDAICWSNAAIKVMCCYAACGLVSIPTRDKLLANRVSCCRATSLSMVLTRRAPSLSMVLTCFPQRDSAELCLCPRCWNCHYRKWIFLGCHFPWFWRTTIVK